MGVYIRMALYIGASFIAGLGYASFDQETGDLYVNIDDITVMVTSALTIATTWLVGRFRKKRGGST